MKTEFNVNLIGATFRATIIPMPYCEWRISNLELISSAAGNIRASAILIDDKQLASANQQIEDQMLADKIEQEQRL
jgi:hypothetical protein